AAMAIPTRLRKGEVVSQLRRVLAMFAGRSCQTGRAERVTMHSSRHGRSRAAAGVVGAMLLSAAAGAQSRLDEPAVEIPLVDQVRTTTRGQPAGPGGIGGRGEGCFEIATHTNASFSGGTYSVQAGLVEGEMMAVSYTLPASVFP